MKILVFSPVTTFPTHSGSSQRVHAVCQGFKRLGHEVHFVYFDHEQPLGTQALREMQAQWDSFHYIPYHPGKRKKLTGQDWLADDWYQDDIGPIVSKLASLYEVDCVYCNYVFQSKLLDHCPVDVIKIIDTHDAFGGRRNLLESLGMAPSFYYTTPAEEAKMLRRADIVVAIQQHEAEYFKRLTTAPVVVVGHFDSLKYAAKRRDHSMRVGYIASSNHLNVRSIKGFIDAFSRNPVDGVQLFIAGKVCERLQDISHPWMTALGQVEELSEFYQGLDIVINPMVGGTGLKIKTIEAMEYGLPILSTSSGFEGLKSDHDWHQLQTADEMVRALHSVSSDDYLLEELRIVSRSTVERHLEHEERNFQSLFASKQTLLNTAGGFAEISSNRRRRKAAVLVVTHASFWKRTYGSHHRIRDLLSGLSANYSVSVFVTRKLSDADIREFKSSGIEVDLNFASANHEIIYSNEPRVVLGDYKYPEQLSDEISTCIRKVNPTTCIIEYLRMAPVVQLLPEQCIRLLDTHDIISRREMSRATVEKSVPGIDRESERKAMSKFDFLLAIQKTEMTVLHNWGFAQRVAYVPVTSRASRLPTRAIDTARTFGFIGAGTPPNIQAAQWLLTCAWPLFQSRSLTLKIAGSVCDSISTSFRNVELLGFVEREDAFFESIDVLVNPVHWGGGLKIKTVQALGMGVPVIASPEASAGCEEADGAGVLIARSSEEFISAIDIFASEGGFLRHHSREALMFACAEFPSSLNLTPVFDIIERASPAWRGRSVSK